MDFASHKFYYDPAREHRGRLLKGKGRALLWKDQAKAQTVPGFVSRLVSVVVPPREQWSGGCFNHLADKRGWIMQGDKNKHLPVGYLMGREGDEPSACVIPVPDGAVPGSLVHLELWSARKSQKRRRDDVSDVDDE